MFQKGDLVKWFFIYVVGIVEETGTGIIIEVFEDPIFGEPYMRYRVYRNEYQDLMTFDYNQIEIF